MKLLRVFLENPNEKYIQQASESILDGNVVCIPTDSGYSLACNALNNSAITKLCAIKKLDPQKKSLSVMCSSIAQAAEYAKISDKAFKDMRLHLPGPFTFILPALSKLPKVFKNRKEVGIRIPDNKLCQELTSVLEQPVLVTSLSYNNKEDMDYAVEPELIADRYNSKIDLILDAGMKSINPTAIIDYTNDSPVVIREGQISF